MEELTKKLELSEIKIDRQEAEAVINFDTSFLSAVGNLWDRLNIKRKLKLQTDIFPKGVIYKDGNFGTIKISHSFKLIQQFAEAKTPLVRCYNEVRTYFQQNY